MTTINTNDGKQVCSADRRSGHPMRWGSAGVPVSAIHRMRAKASIFRAIRRTDQKGRRGSNSSRKDQVFAVRPL